MIACVSVLITIALIHNLTHKEDVWFTLISMILCYQIHPVASVIIFMYAVFRKNM